MSTSAIEPTFSDVLVKPLLGFINLIGSINESLSETHFVKVQGEAEIIS